MRGLGSTHLLTGGRVDIDMQDRLTIGLNWLSRILNYSPGMEGFTGELLPEKSSCERYSHSLSKCSRSSYLEAGQLRRHTQEFNR